ncbi:transcription-associated protein 1-like protein [Tanacetum coccineum]
MLQTPCIRCSRQSREIRKTWFLLKGTRGRSNVEDRFPAVLKLEEESRVLHDFHVVEVEVPGQYFTDEEVAPDHTIKLDRVGADITIVRRHGSSYRRFTLIGSDGSQCHSIVQTSLTPNARSDERILQLFRVMNRMFDKHKESNGDAINNISHP